jgi:hypothetical protein
MGWVGPAIQAGGAVLGGLAGGKGGSSGPSAPRWLKKDAKALAQMGQGLAQRPYEAYTGGRVAPFSQDTLSAFDMIRGNLGAATPSYQNALSTAQNLTNFNAPQVGNVSASQWAGQDLSPYMNPYIQSVIDAQMADQQNAYGQQYNQMASAAQAAGAFGGSRFGVAQGQLAADSVRNQALMSAQLRSQGFDTAAGLLGQDVDRMNWATGLNQNTALANQQAAIQSAGIQGGAAQMQGSLAGQYQNSLAQDAQGLAGAGAAQQALAQQQLDVGYGDYMDRTRAYPTQQLNWWSGSMSPAIAAAGMQSPQQGGGLLGALGGAQIGSQLASSIYDWWKPPSGTTGSPTGNWSGPRP